MNVIRISTVACAVVLLAGCDGGAPEGTGDCASASVLNGIIGVDGREAGIWNQISATHPNRDSWLLETMRFFSDCRLQARAFTPSTDDGPFWEPGYYRQSGRDISMSFDHWPDRTAQIDPDDEDRMVQTESRVIEGGQWVIVATRDAYTGDPVPPPDAGPAVVCHNETPCADLQTSRSDMWCPDQLRVAVDNDCDYAISCSLAFWTGDRFQNEYDNITYGPNWDGMYGTNTHGCRATGSARWILRCSLPEDDPTCRELAEPGAGREYLLTCNDGRAGIEQCVHYTFDSLAERDDYYGRCAGLTSRTRDSHNCPLGATGGGYCRVTEGGRVSETYTYNGTESELRSRCTSGPGIWVSG